MENAQRIEYYEDEFGITGDAYQRRAANCLSVLLASFQPSPKQSPKTRLRRPTLNEDNPFKITVNDNPPSAQILQLPKGGVNAGIQRIRQKMTETIQPNPDLPILLLPSIVVAQETDLTRECVIASLRAKTIKTIIDSALLSPKESADILEILRGTHPHLLVVLQRYLIGIERDDGIKVPYQLVEASDEKTLQYLEQLPAELN